MAELQVLTVFEITVKMLCYTMCTLLTVKIDKKKKILDCFFTVTRHLGWLCGEFVVVVVVCALYLPIKYIK